MAKGLDAKMKQNRYIVTNHLNLFNFSNKISYISVNLGYLHESKYDLTAYYWQINVWDQDGYFGVSGPFIAHFGLIFDTWEAYERDFMATQLYYIAL